ncbi:hypothetical protein MUN74_12170 [Agromyces endophyticus]|uniref:hypothetical protein n=1 Tax=Agromyces sp. H17E-10 TaxID=2932244 RepID=UPI001FD1917D|nr:hypothetical protein [Agromyces sp. H17E-10]UOQ88048.1 hypothetical protein MUN74_12170 [Agromyces sp. H17E-10]
MIRDDSTQTPRTLTYEEYNSALVEAYFSPTRAGQPVYLDLDDAVLADAAQSLSLDRDEFTLGLQFAVRARLPIRHPGVNMLDEFNRDLDRWTPRFRRAITAGKRPPHPPIVALLVVFTMAAEHMGDSAQSDIHTNAYYAHLNRLLGLPESDEGRFRTAFQHHSESYWAALAAWLESFDGEIGLPTAVALSHRYIGLPVSQAVVREAERKQLLRMFEETGLPTGTAISAIDMEASLGDWITSADPPPSKSFARLWESSARDAVVDVAVNELVVWDGVPRYGRSKRRGRADGAAELREVRLGLSEEFGIFGNEFRFVAIGPPYSDGTPVTLETMNGDLPVTYTSVSNGSSAIPFEPNGITAAQGLAGVLRLNDPTGTRTRIPRKVVPLALDALTGLLIETDRMPIGARAALLVSEDESLADQAASMLEDAARPGFKRVQSAQGVPPRWSLFVDVTMLQPPISPRAGLEALLPRLTVQMTLAGGFRMPGRLTRWSALSLPELTVVSDDDHPVEIEIQRRELGEQHAAVSVHSGPPPIVIPLDRYVTAEGDYDIVLKRDRRSIQATTLRVRSAAEPDQSSWSRAIGIGHDSADGLWPLRARAIEGELIVDGALTLVGGQMVRSPAPHSEVTVVGDSEQHAAEGSPVVLPRPEPTSCILTGRHRFQLPRAVPDSKEPYVVGVCSTCGLRKRYPTDHWRARKRQQQRKTLEPRPLADFEPAPEHGSWNAAVDALVYLGSGNSSDLSAIARQVENSAMFEHHFVRSLESLGVIETERDDSLVVRSFEIAATSMAEVDGGFLLTGSWSHVDLATALSAADERGIPSDWPSGVGVPVPVVRIDANSIPDDVRLDSTIATDAGLNMLLTLPHINELAKHLATTRSGLVAGRAERFAPEDARWVRADSVDQPGAYRSRSFAGADYFVRSESDVESNEARQVRSDTAKYIAASWAAVSLVRYDKRDRVLSVPLGTPLPGLYERAAVLSSGKLPTPTRKGWTLAYHAITPEFAEQMIARLL